MNLSSGIVKLVACFFLFTCISQSLLGQQNPYASKHALEELAMIKHAIVNYHPAPFRYISKASWTHQCEKVKNAISAKDSIHMFEFVSLVSPLVSLLRDEHSNLYPNDGVMKDWSLTKKFFPFQVSIALDSSLTISGIIDPSIDTAFIGEKIVSINGRSSQDIIEILKICGGTSASTDYSGTLYHAFNFDNFSRLYYLCVDQSETFELQFASDRKLRFSGFNTKKESTSIYQLNPETPNEFYISEDSSFAYLSVSTFWPEAYGAKYNRVLKEVDNYFKQLKAFGIKKIVIDVRGNRGGTPFYAGHLAGYFFEQPFHPMKRITAKKQAVEDFPKRFKAIRKPVVSLKSDIVTLPKLQKAFRVKHREDLIFKGEAIVLIDAGTGSAASIFAGLMSASDQVRFLGEETLGDAHITTGGQFKHFELPYSHLVLTIPLLSFQHGNNESSHGVKTDSPLIDPSLILSEGH